MPLAPILLVAAVLLTPSAFAKDPAAVTWTGHTGPVFAVAFSPDGKSALSASFDNSIKLWSAATGKEMATWIGHNDQVRAIAYSPDGMTALSGSKDKTIKLWDIATGNELATWTGHSATVYALALHPAGRTALSASRDGTLKLWDVASGSMTATWTGHADEVTTVAFAPDGKRAYSGSVDKTIKVWDVATGREIDTWKEHTAPVMCLAISPDGKLALSGGEDNTIRVWDIATGKRLSLWKEHKNAVRALAFSLDGQLAASGGFDKTIHIWDVASRRNILTLAPDSEYTYSAAFAPDGRTALFGTGDTLKALDIASLVKQSPKPKIAERLQIKAEFVELPNGILDAEETATLNVTVSNPGSLPTYETQLEISYPFVTGLTVPKAVKLGKIGAGKTVLREIPLAASKDVATVRVLLKLEVKEGNGFDAEPVTAEFKTRAFEAPKLELDDISIGGSGVIKQGENARLTVTVRNSGGIAKNVAAKLSSSDSNISISEYLVKIGRMEPGDSRKTEFTFLVGPNFKATDLPLSMSLSESRGKFGISSQSMKLSLAGPATPTPP